MPCPGSEPLGMTRRSGAQGLSGMFTKINEGNQPTQLNVNVNGCILDMYVYIYIGYTYIYIHLYIIQYHIYIYIML